MRSSPVGMTVARVGARVLLGLALTVVVGVALAPLSTASAADVGARRIDGISEDWTNTPTGPLGPADRDLLVRVRQAGLWEGPAGQMAQTQAGSETVKTVGHHLQADHATLDQITRSVASQLQVALPDQPSVEQQGWLGELSSARGTEFDRIFADRLRAAHGKVFGIVAAVRAGTRNDTIRNYAQTAVTVVMKHMTLLEGTGRVDYGALPTPAAPGTVNPSLASQRLAGINPNLVWLVLGIAAVAGLVTAGRVVRPR
jgi:predicted outer membrane protein